MKQPCPTPTPTPISYFTYSIWISFYCWYENEYVTFFHLWKIRAVEYSTLMQVVRLFDEIIQDGLILSNATFCVFITSMQREVYCFNRLAQSKLTTGLEPCWSFIYTVIDWVRGQQQFCLTRGRICCPKPQAEGNRSVRGSNKTAVVREASL